MNVARCGDDEVQIVVAVPVVCAGIAGVVGLYELPFGVLEYRGCVVFAFAIVKVKIKVARITAGEHVHIAVAIPIDRFGAEAHAAGDRDFGDFASGLKPLEAIIARFGLGANISVNSEAPPHVKTILEIESSFAKFADKQITDSISVKIEQVRRSVAGVDVDYLAAGFQAKRLFEIMEMNEIFLLQHWSTLGQQVLTNC